jgi:uncharacterized linocin/CFP29 family protein
MTQNNPQVPWTDEQWARVNQVIQEEASRARVAATFLPLHGPLPADADFVRAQKISYSESQKVLADKLNQLQKALGDLASAQTVDDAKAAQHRIDDAQAILGRQKLRIDDQATIQLATLQVKVRVRSAQMADPEMVSVLSLFRRAANVLARLEDAVVFRGLVQKIGLEPPGGLDGLPTIWEIHGGQPMPGLWVPRQNNPWSDSPFPTPEEWQWIIVPANGDALVSAVSDAIGRLECRGQFGPFAAVFGQGFFLAVQTPNQHLVLPQDRIIPFLGGGPLLRSSTLDDKEKYIGLVVALGGAPIELVVGTDVSLQFIQVTEDPSFLFRVREKIALRVKETEAIVRLYSPPNGNLIPTVSSVTPRVGPIGGGTRVTITGTNLRWATAVQFGTTNLSKFDVNSDIEITVDSPGGAGTVHITMTTPGGTSVNSPADQFTYVAVPTVTEILPRP